MNWTPETNRPYVASCVVEKKIPVGQIDALSVENGIVNSADFDGFAPGCVLVNGVVLVHHNDGRATVGVRLEKYAEPLERTAGALTAVRAFVGN